MKPAELTHKISQARITMRKSERKVAEFVLNNAREVISLRIVDLAARAEVSEPTVVRFCRAIGCEGFQEFKLSLAQQLASSPSVGQVAVTDTDSVEDFSHKVFDATVDTLLKVRDSLNAMHIYKAIDVLAAAKRVEFYGFGASAAVASDAQHRFFRLQLATAAYSDAHTQKMSAMSLSAGDVVVAISQSGRTRALVETMELVKSTGGIVIGLAPSHTPITKAASIPICVDVEEEFEIYTPLSSRIAHLTIIDVLAIGVAQRKGPALQKHLYRMKEGMQTLRIPEESKNKKSL
jgi:RpiR family transcriptional regulator, carbohydrate utilization regulator